LGPEPKILADLMAYLVDIAVSVVYFFNKFIFEVLWPESVDY